MMGSKTQMLEFPRHQFGKNIKMDTTLENIYPKHFSEASDLSSFSSGTVPSERFGCQHKKLVTQESYDSCFNCGAFVPKNGNKIFKSGRMNYLASFPPRTIYRAMTKRLNYFRQSFNPEYSQMRQAYVEWILEIADKLRISNHSVHLAVHLLDVIMYKDNSLTPSLQLYAPVCLLIAAKTVELDERIPYLPKLRSYANSSFSIEAYRKAELYVLDLLGWNPQFSSAFEITEFLLCQGVLFSNDEVEDGSCQEPEQEPLRENTQHSNLNSHRKRNSETKKITSTPRVIERAFSSHKKKNNNENILSQSQAFDHLGATCNTQPPLAEEDLPSSRGIPYFMKHNSMSPTTHRDQFAFAPKNTVLIQRNVEDIVRHIEANYSKLSLLILKDIDFIQWDQQVIAAACICFLRYLNKIVFLWNNELEIITQLSFSQVSSCFALISKKYTSAFSFNKLKYENILYHGENLKEINFDIKSITTNEKKHQKKLTKLEFKHTSTYKENNLNLIKPMVTLNQSSSRQELTIFDTKLQQQEKKTIFRNPSKTTLQSNATLAIPYDQIWENFNSTMYLTETSNAENIPKKNPIFSGSDKTSQGGDYSRLYSQTQPLTFETSRKEKEKEKENSIVSYLPEALRAIFTSRDVSRNETEGNGSLTNNMINTNWENIGVYRRRK